ncbi:hypothetical protein [Trichormus azollae]|jgi:hypothetical protein|uniref:Uncharacterized protein n=1 Tax=Nostoc azollae (strain 0708) TaxID=551115 RepID=D7E234_NOSA0|nr:hypothetical protein [Trichormus azollae]ADI63312.1 hypothetical protein Aazo_0910 ['Nostoc azollae' 0708]
MSHSEHGWCGVPPTKVPKPSVMLGVFGVDGIVAAQRKLKKVSG